MEKDYKGHPMKWYRFLVCFGVWAAAVLNLVSGFLYLTGGIVDMVGAEKGVTAAEYYKAYVGLERMDHFMGYISIAAAVLFLVAGIMLLKLKKLGPTLFVAALALMLGANIAYVIFAGKIITDYAKAHNVEVPSMASSWSSIAVSAVVLILNLIYFNKRKDVFVN